MGMCCERKMIWLGEEMYGYQVESCRPRGNRGPEERLWKRTAKYVNWTRRMLWVVVDGGSWQRTVGCEWVNASCGTGPPGSSRTKVVCVCVCSTAAAIEPIRVSFPGTLGSAGAAVARPIKWATERAAASRPLPPCLRRLLLAAAERLSRAAGRGRATIETVVGHSPPRTSAPSAKQHRGHLFLFLFLSFVWCPLSVFCLFLIVIITTCICSGDQLWWCIPSGSLPLYCFSLQLLFVIVANKISIYLSIICPLAIGLGVWSWSRGRFDLDPRSGPVFSVFMYVHREAEKKNNFLCASF